MRERERERDHACMLFGKRVARGGRIFEGDVGG